MRTKIEYSVDLQDVPKELQERFENLSQSLHELGNYLQALKHDLEYDNISIISARIDRTRRRLLQIDNGLEDCDKTIGSYGATVREIQKQQVEAAQAAQTAPLPSTPDEGLNE
tara:strand:+ start:1254 stop:1592 length:339 start_codon:yes stop_codon:yes gene_type:complete